MEYVNYSPEGFDKKLFNEISNSKWIKPDGGLWACRTDSPYQWIDWCKDSDFKLDKYKVPFIFELTDTANILRIKTPEDFNLLYPYAIDYTTDPISFDSTNFLQRIVFRNIDFVKMDRDGYDGVEVFPVTGHPTIQWALYGWDVDSIVLFNTHCIKTKRERKRYYEL